MSVLRPYTYFVPSVIVAILGLFVYGVCMGIPYWEIWNGVGKEQLIIFELLTFIIDYLILSSS